MSEREAQEIARSKGRASSGANTGWRVGNRVAETYEVLEVLGQGGMGVVHRVRHLGWRMDLAVKSPLPHLVNGETDQEGFVREAETWVGLGLHPHVCTCHYVRALEGIPRVFSEYLEAGSLKDWIGDGRLYEGGTYQVMTRILDIAVQSAWGLTHAHRQGLVHQDVKPANILLDAEGNAKITDFGLARAQTPGAARATGASALTLQVTAGGMTPAYASPEQAANRPLGRRSDVWSLAVSLLEMATGQVTWYAGPVAGAALAALCDEPHAKWAPGVHMSESLAALLANCLREDPAQRPDMEGLASELLRLYEAHTGRPYPRPAPDSPDLRAEELNNRALSLLDLGREDEAAQLFAAALSADPQHPEALYNSGLLQWRAGEVTDEALLHELDVARGNSERPSDVEELIARVHLERGDLYSARALAEAVERGESHVPVRLPEGPGQRETTFAEAGEDVLDLAGHVDHVVCVDVTPDARHALTAGLDGTVRVWDWRTGRLLRTLYVHTEEVNSVCAMPDSRRAVSADSDGTVHIWDIATGEVLHTLTGHEGAVYSACVTPHDHRVMTAGEDGTLREWQQQASGAWTCRQILDGHDGSVTGICVTPDARLTVSAGEDGTVRIWDMAGGSPPRTLAGHQGSVSAVCVTADGRSTVSAGEDGTVRVWDLDSGACRHILTGHDGQVVHSVSATRDGVLSAGFDGTVRIWDIATGNLVSTLTRRLAPDAEGSIPALYAVCVTPDGEHALSADAGSEVQVWELPAGRHLRSLTGHTGVVTGVCAVPDGRHALSASGDDTVRLWDLDTGGCVRILRGHTDSAAPVAVTPDGRHALSGGQGGTVRMWDLELGECMRVFGGGTDYVTSLQVTPDGSFALVSDNERTVVVWELATGRRVCELGRPNGYVYDVCVTPDGRLALAACAGSSLWVWDLTARGQARRLRTGHTVGIASVCTTPDGRHALTGGLDGKVGVWDLATEVCVRTMRAGDNAVNSICVTPDGRHAVTAGDDGTVRVWELSSGRCVRTLTGHLAGVEEVAVTPDGQVLLSAGRDGSVRVWRQWRTGTRAAFQICRPRRHAELARLEEEVLGLVDEALHAMEQQQYTKALDLLSKARSRPGYERMSHVMDAWRRLDPHCARTDIRSAMLVGRLRGHERAVDSVCVTPDGRYALTAGLDKTVRVWELPSGRQMHALTGHSGLVRAVCVTPDGRHALSVAQEDVFDDGRLFFHDVIRVWDVGGGHQLCVFAGERFDTATSGARPALCVAPDGLHFLSASRDHTVLVRQLSSGKVVTALAGHEGRVQSVCVTPDGQRAVTASQDGTLRLWQLATGACLDTVESYAVTSLCLTRDGRLALSTGARGEVEIWDVSGGEWVEHRTLQSHTLTEWVSVCATADGRYALFGSYQGTMELWELSTGRRLRTLTGHTGSVNSICVTPGSGHALSAGNDGSVRIWELDWELGAAGA